MAMPSSTNIDKPSGTAAKSTTGQSIPSEIEDMPTWRPGADERPSSPTSTESVSEGPWVQRESPVERNHDYPGPQSFAAKFESFSTRVDGFARPLIKDAGNYAQRAGAKLTATIKKYPMPALLIALSVGAGLGALRKKKM
jgi:hypothetical protein